MSAEERRSQVLRVAVEAFARGGYDGTSTEDVARAAGISQPYLFRLFPTKKALFCALVERGFGRVSEAFAEAADGLSGQDALDAMAGAYGVLLADRDLLLIQLHAYAACDDLEVRDVTRAAFRRLWELVGRISGMPAEDVRGFFAMGMLLNVIAAMDAADLDETWAGDCLPESLRR